MEWGGPSSRTLPTAKTTLPAQAPVLCAPRAMPKRSTGPKGRIALVHALAHIELNAIDLAWDIVARFTSHNLPTDFYNDWVEVADEEAKHFQALVQRLTSWTSCTAIFLPTMVCGKQRLLPQNRCPLAWPSFQ